MTSTEETITTEVDKSGIHRKAKKQLEIKAKYQAE